MCGDWNATLLFGIHHLYSRYVYSSLLPHNWVCIPPSVLLSLRTFSWIRPSSTTSSHLHYSIPSPQGVPPGSTWLPSTTSMAVIWSTWPPLQTWSESAPVHVMGYPWSTQPLLHPHPHKPVPVSRVWVHCRYGWVQVSHAGMETAWVTLGFGGFHLDVDQLKLLLQYIHSQPPIHLALLPFYIRQSRLPPSHPVLHQTHPTPSTKDTLVHVWTELRVHFRT